VSKLTDLSAIKLRLRTKLAEEKRFKVFLITHYNACRAIFSSQNKSNGLQLRWNVWECLFQVKTESQIAVHLRSDHIPQHIGTGAPTKDLSNHLWFSPHTAHANE